MQAYVRTALAALLVLVSSAVAFADDWVAIRLRGSVLQLVDGDWQKLSRGDIVPDSRVIRTLGNGSAEFERGQERVALGANTQIQIYDKVRQRPFTTVKQYFGTVTVEAEVQDVQHFAVQTPYLAAVVKGTKFTVHSGDSGASVDVERGKVFVEDTATKNNVTVTVGQTAAVGTSGGTPTVTDHTSLSGLFAPKTSSDDETSDTSDDADANSNNGKSDDKSNNGKSDDKTNNGKSDKTDDKTNNGKSDKSDGKTNNGKSDKSDGKSNNGKSSDSSGKGKSGHSDHHGKSGKSDHHSGKGKSDHDDDDD